MLGRDKENCNVNQEMCIPREGNKLRNVHNYTYLGVEIAIDLVLDDRVKNVLVK